MESPSETMQLDRYSLKNSFATITDDYNFTFSTLKQQTAEAFDAFTGLLVQ